MRKIILLLLLALPHLGNAQRLKQPMSDPYVLVLHGGAGYIKKENLTDEKEAAYKAALLDALQSGYKQLQATNSLDAVVAAIKVLENSPLFNAGKGAVYTSDGRNELDASIMDGKTLQAGAVAGVTIIKNPIEAALAVMQKSPHVMLAGTGAEIFWKQLGKDTVAPEYFRTPESWNNYLKQRQTDTTSKTMKPLTPDAKFGTVGCVALDKKGNLAAGTSTGGMMNKKFGRVGDSPIIGAGTYANNKTVAVSCTGWGEHYIRNVAAYDVAAQMEYRHSSIKKATANTLLRIKKTGGEGGIIALDKWGNISMDFNTPGMFRAAITQSGKITVEIFGK